jgi:hypothetical protein
VKASTLGIGQHTFRVHLDFGHGATAVKAVTWDVLENSELR